MRFGIIDLGSNSIRLVIFEGLSRNPHVIFNEKAIIGLARGLNDTGKLNPGASELAITIVSRYHAIASGFDCERLEILATAAVREARDGNAFLARVQAAAPSVAIIVLTGNEEARISANGVLLGNPSANGVIADLGGGSLELARLSHGEVTESVSLSIGTIRLSDMSDGSLLLAKSIVEEKINTVKWAIPAECQNIYLVGGGFRAFAKLHISAISYPLSMIHNYTIGKSEARNYAQKLISTKNPIRDKIQIVSTKRLDDLPFVAIIIREILRVFKPEQVIFSANGLREGWYSALLPEAIRNQDPVISAAKELGARLGRNDLFPDALLVWMMNININLRDNEKKLLIASVLLCDVGCYDHPDYRAEQSFDRIFLQNGAGLDHVVRAFLAVVIAIRYDAKLSDRFLQGALYLLDERNRDIANQIGLAFRLAFTLSAGIAEILKETRIESRKQGLFLTLPRSNTVFPGEAIDRRVGFLADALRVNGFVEMV